MLPATEPHRSLFLSDLHLGTNRTDAGRLLALLLRHPSQRLFLVGDILDLNAWQRSAGVISQQEMRLLQWLLSADAPAEVVWVLGNHERMLQQRISSTVAAGRLQVCPRTTYEAMDGRRIAVIHGDAVGHGSGRWHRLDNFGYHCLTRVERWSRRLGAPSPTLAVQQGRRGQQLINGFHHEAATWARDQGFDGVICGHIHSACLEDRDGIRVMNTGCWTHPPGTLLVETAAGTWQLWDGNGTCISALAAG